MKHAAGVILVHPNGSVLMQHRDNIPNIAYPDYWSLPGGVVEEGESYEEAAKRELIEETGYRATKVRPLETSLYKLENGTEVTRHIYWAIYDQRQAIKCLEGKEMRFVNPNEFPNFKIYPGHEKMFELAIREARNSGFLKK